MSCQLVFPCVPETELPNPYGRGSVGEKEQLPSYNCLDNLACWVSLAQKEMSDGRFKQAGDILISMHESLSTFDITEGQKEHWKMTITRLLKDCVQALESA